MVAESPWLEHLNEQQRAAATHVGGPLLILAGAGTGKTTTLCSRLAWLVALVVMGVGFAAGYLLVAPRVVAVARDLEERLTGIRGRHGTP